MTRIIVLALCLAVGGCSVVGWGPQPYGVSELSQQTIKGMPPSVWTCYQNREPECQ